MLDKNFNKQEEFKQRLKEKEEFNSTSSSFNIVNQNQGHNIKKQALGPNTRR